MKFWILFSAGLTFSLVQARAQSLPPRGELSQAHDKTQSFEEIYFSPDKYFTRETAANLKNYKIIFVSGFLSDLYTLLGKENFAEQVRWLKDDLGFKQGEDYEVAPINSFATSKQNAPILKDMIIKSEKPVILMGHSKGGLDIINTLVRHPETQEKVAGVIPLQTPFFGSQVADYFVEHYLFDKIFYGVLRFAGGDKRSLIKLTTQKGEAFYNKYQDRIGPIVKNIPILSFVGWFSPEKKVEIDRSLAGIFSNILLPFRIMLNNKGINSDGLVPRDHQVIPGCDYVVMEGLDHLSAVMDSAHRIEKIDLTKSLLVLLLQKIENP